MAAPTATTGAPVAQPHKYNHPSNDNDEIEEIGLLDQLKLACSSSQCKKIALIVVTVAAVLGAAFTGYVCREELGQFGVGLAFGGTVLLVALTILGLTNRKSKKITKFILLALAGLTLLAIGGAGADAGHHGKVTEGILDFFKERKWECLAGGIAGGVVSGCLVGIFKALLPKKPTRMMRDSIDYEVTYTDGNNHTHPPPHIQPRSPNSIVPKEERIAPLFFCFKTR